MYTELSTLSRCKSFLGTYVELDVQADLEFEALAALSTTGFNKIFEVQEALSFHNLDSELTLVNSSAHQSPITMSPHFASVIHFALELAEATDGMFDPTIAPHLIQQELLPAHAGIKVGATATWEDIILIGDQIYFQQPLLIDLGGIAKGYAVDQALAAILAEKPTANVRINAGGDLIDTQWKDKSLIIRDPKTSRPEHEIEMLKCAVATSSSYYQDTGKHPIINTLTRQPLKLKHSISVFANDCMTADALTKVFAIHPSSNIHLQYGAAPITIY